MQAQEESTLGHRRGLGPGLRVLALGQRHDRKRLANASEPHAMLEFLRISERTSDRKLRLFAVACSRRSWLWIDTLGRAAVEVAEDFADGRVGPEELRVARLACRAAGVQAAWYAATTNPEIAARSAQAGVVNNGGSESAELLAQAALVRDIFGFPPFRRLSVDVMWLAPKVVTLAQEIYDDQDFERLPSLVDAVEEAGCNSAEILNHCRGLGPHVRGCWAVDLVLGKE